MNTALILAFVSDKVIPLLLIVFAGGAYKLGLPAEFCTAIGGAGLLAFQRSAPNGAPAQSSQSPQS